jgi:hypothetical protein
LAIPVVWGIFPVLHVSHGLGFAAGLVKYKLDPDWAPPETLGPRATQGASETNGAQVHSTLAEPAGAHNG